MSIKARLKAIESKVKTNDLAVGADPVDKEILIFMDYEEYRTVFVEWLMSKYVGDSQKAAEMERKVDSFANSLEPISKPSRLNLEEYQKLLAVKIVDWMEENHVDFEDEKWEALLDGFEKETE